MRQIENYCIVFEDNYRNATGTGRLLRVMAREYIENIIRKNVNNRHN